VIYVAALVIAAALGVCVRAFHVLSSDFPLNDGGMFFAMAQDLQNGGYSLPSFTSYNGGEIPYTYPPLGFYMAAAIDDLTPLALIEVFRFLPLLAAALTVPAFVLLARSMLTSRVAALAAVLAFALAPRSFMWLLMGGGVTRAPGFLFAILALYCVHQLYTRGRRTMVPWAILFCSLTVLSHLETGWFLAFSIALFLAAYGRNRTALADSALIAAGTIAVTSLWWLQILSTHGLEPLETVFGSGGSVFSGGEATRGAYMGLLNLVSTSEPLFPLIGVLAVFGGIACLSTRRFFLPAWWAAIILLDVRAFPTFTTLPVALMAGVAVSEVLLPLLANRQGSAPLQPETALLQRLQPAGTAILAAFVLFSVASALLRAPGLNGEAGNLRGLSGDELAALTWVREETPSGSSFLVVPDGAWETAKTAEWFPVLAGRLSVATVQGTEWVSNGGFDRARAIYDHAFDCGFRTTVCLDELAAEHGVAFDYVYVRKGETGQCCDTLLDSLTTDAAYQLVYEDDGATVYLKRGEGEPAVKASGPD